MYMRKPNINSRHLRIFALSVTVLFGVAISLISYIKNYPFIPGPDSPFYLWKMEVIAQGGWFPIDPANPPLFPIILGYARMLTKIDGFYISAFFISLLSGVQIVVNYRFGEKIGGSSRVGILAALLSLGVYAKYRMAWDLYNNYFSITMLWVLLLVLSSNIKLYGKYLFITIFSVAMFYSHPITATVFLGMMVLILLFSFIEKITTKEMPKQDISLLISSVWASISGFIAAWPFTSQFFLGMNKYGYSAASFVQNGLDDKGNILSNLLNNITKIPFQQWAYTTYIQKYYLALTSIGFLFIVRGILQKERNAKQSRISSILLVCYLLAVVGLSQTQLLGIDMLQDRFVLMLFPAVGVASAIGVDKIITLISDFIYKDKYVKQREIFYKLCLSAFVFSYISVYPLRASNYQLLNLGTTIDQSQYNAIKFTGNRMDLKSDVIIVNDLYRYWIYALFPNINMSFGEYYYISGDKWPEGLYNPDDMDELEQNSAILTSKTDFGLSAESSYELLHNRYPSNARLYLFMRRNELPGYTDWQKFDSRPDLYEKIYDVDDYLVFEMKK